MHTLRTIEKLFKYYKELAERAIKQVDDDAFFKEINDSNSIAIIIKHIAGNLKSRFTNFFTEDGEKAWRNRDSEFIADMSRKELLEYWESSWAILFDLFNSLTEENKNDIIYIRNEGHKVEDAMLRQLTHYAYHVGQIVTLSKQFCENEWETLSIAKNSSNAFNKTKFAADKKNKFFTNK